MGMSQLIVVALDVLGSHTIHDKPHLNCEMRIAQHPNGYWYCVDCGVAITVKRIGVDTECGALEFDFKCPKCQTELKERQVKYTDGSFSRELEPYCPKCHKEKP